jgi:hypothetical protein
VGQNREEASEKKCPINGIDPETVCLSALWGNFIFVTGGIPLYK